MKRVIGRIYYVLAWVVLAGLCLQVYLAGVGLFGAESMTPHRTLGMMIGIPMLLMLILAPIGRLGRHLVVRSALLFVFTAVQIMLPQLQSSAPWIAALHALNALALIGLSFDIARRVQWKATADDRDNAEMEMSGAPLQD